MLAGFIAGSLSGDNSYALKLGTACGGATAFSDSLARKEQIDALLEKLL
jgi:1-phosphofructokinase